MGNTIPVIISSCYSAIEAFGKNEQVKRVFWTLFVVMAGLMLTRVVDPVTAQQVVGVIGSSGP